MLVLTIGPSGVTAIDPWLSPFKDALKRRFAKSKEWIEKIEATEGGLDKFSKVSPSFLGQPAAANFMLTPPTSRAPRSLV